MKYIKTKFLLAEFSGELGAKPGLMQDKKDKDDLDAARRLFGGKSDKKKVEPAAVEAATPAKGDVDISRIVDLFRKGTVSMGQSNADNYISISLVGAEGENYTKGMDAIRAKFSLKQNSSHSVPKGNDVYDHTIILHRDNKIDAMDVQKYINTPEFKNDVIKN